MSARAPQRSGGLGKARVAKNKMFLQGKWVGVGSEGDQVAKSDCFWMKMARFRVLGGLGFAKNNDLNMRTNRFRVLGVLG